MQTQATVFATINATGGCSALCSEDRDRIGVADLAALTPRRRQAKAAVIDVPVEHRGDLDVVAGVRKRAAKQAAHGVAELVVRLLWRRQPDLRKQRLQLRQRQ